MIFIFSVEYGVHRLGVLVFVDCLGSKVTSQLGEEHNCISGPNTVGKSAVVFELYIDDVFLSEIFEEGGLVRVTIMLTSFGR